MAICPTCPMPVYQSSAAWAVVVPMAAIARAIRVGAIFIFIVLSS